MQIRKRNGKLEDFNAEKINKFVERCCAGLNNVSASEIVLDAKISFRNKIPTSEIDNSLELTARSKIWKHPEYGFAAAQIHLSGLYKKIIGDSVDKDTFLEDYKSRFIKNIKKGVKLGLLDSRMLNYDLKLLSEYLVPSRDDIFDYCGIKNLSDRYLLKDRDKNIIETPQAFYMRIAMGLCFNEDSNFVYELYDTYSQHLASPSTPTLFNSGTTHPQLSSCYLSAIGDSIDSIFDGLWQEARKSKYAGGLGFHMSSIRGTGSDIKGTNGESSGLIPWLKIYNDMLIGVNQGGRRPGSGAVYIEPWHPDIYEFLDIRKNIGDDRRRCRDLNTALWIPDLFFERVESDGDWTLFCPSVCPDLHESFGEEFNNRYTKYEEAGIGKKIKAKDLWKEILKTLFETSHPWICFKDRCNERYSNQHMGVIHGSNLCSEISLRNYPAEYEDGVKTKPGLTAVCTLASLCLPNHMDCVNGKWEINYKKLENTIKKVIRGLDNVIDINFYPTEESKIGATEDRPLGMGTIGWANLFARMEIPMDSEEAVRIAAELMEFISYHAISTSNELAKKKGSYPTFNGSLWSQGILPFETAGEYIDKLGIKLKLDWELLRNSVKEGMRNSNLLAIAPNASIAYILGFSQSIEPNYSLVYTYENLSGKSTIIDKDFVKDMEREGLWTTEFAQLVMDAEGDPKNLPIPDKYKSVYSTAFNKDQIGLIKTNAARQIFIDQAISFNLYNGETSLKFLNDIYMNAWKYGLKTTYYLRNKRANQAEKMNSPAQETKSCSILDPTCESCQG